MKKSALFSALFLSSSLFAGELLLFASPKDCEVPRYISVVSEGVFQNRPNSWIVTKKSFPVDTAKRYCISVEVRTVDGKKGKPLRLAFSPKSEQRRNLHISALMPIAGTESFVLETAPATAKSFRIKDGSKWDAKLPSRVVFDADPDGKLRDIPNFDLLNGRVLSVTKENGGYLVTMNRAIGFKLEAGMCVRQHKDGRNAVMSSPFTPDGEWRKFEFVTRPGVTANGSANDKFYPGTKFVSGMIQTPEPIQFRNYKIEELEK